MKNNRMKRWMGMLLTAALLLNQGAVMSVSVFAAEENAAIQVAEVNSSSQETGEKTSPQAVEEIENSGEISMQAVPVETFSEEEENAGDASILVSGNIGKWNKSAYGENVKWTLDTDYNLSITGSGEMYEGNLWNDGDAWRPYIEQIHTVTFSEGITTIPGYALSGAKSLQGTLILPSTLQKIGASAFGGCSGLKGDLVIPNGVTEIGEHAFSDCFGFDGTLTIGSGVVTIGDRAFDDCNNLQGTLNFGNALETIGDGAFYDCESLDGSISFGNGITSIGSSAFSDCKNLGGTLTIPSTVTMLGSGAFSRTKITSATINAELAKIEDFMFGGCNQLGSVNIPGTVTEIGESAFGGTAISGVVLPSGIKKIGKGAFSGCENLSSVSIPAGIESIGNNAFSDCTGLTAITVDNGCNAYKTVDGVLFNRTGDILLQYPAGKTTTDYTMPIGVQTISDNAFSRAVFLQTVRFCASLTEIGWDSFEKCAALKTLVFPEDSNLKVIGIGAFYECENLENPVLPDCVTTIYRHAFWDCNITAFTVPESVTVLDDGCIVGGDKLEEVILPVGIKKLGSSYEEVFWGDSFRKITYRGSKEQWSRVVVQKNAIDYDEVTVVCSDGTYDPGEEFLPVSGYCGEDGTGTNVSWTLTDEGMLMINGSGQMGSQLSEKGYSEIWQKQKEKITGLTITGNITSIGAGSFSGLSNIRGNLVIPDTVTEIGDAAFLDCSGFTGSLVLPSGLTYIGDGAFSGCSGFTGDLIIPGGVESIPQNAFYQCYGFTGALTIGEGVKEIGPHAFWEGTGINSEGKIECTTFSLLQLASSVTTIEDGAFYGCGFNGVTLPEGLITLEENAFEDCLNITGTVSLPASLVRFGEPDNTSDPYLGNPFKGCKGITGFEVKDGNENYWAYEGIVYNKAKTELIAFPSGKTVSANSLHIPDTLEKVREGAFCRAENLSGTLSFPGSLQEIGDNFDWCPNLTAIRFPVNVTKIGEYCQGNGIVEIFYGGKIADYTLLLNNNPECADFYKTSTVYCSDGDIDRKCKIWFYPDNGEDDREDLKTRWVTAGSEITLPVVEKAGYTFKGWIFTNSSNYEKTTVTGTTFTVTASGYFSAQWEETKVDPTPTPAPTPTPTPTPTPAKEIHIVTFMNGDKEVERQTVEHGKSAKEPSAKPYREGAEFMGWASGSTLWNFAMPVYTDLELNAMFVAANPLGVSANTGSGKDAVPVVTDDGIYLVKGQTYIAGGTNWTVRSGSGVVSVVKNTGKITAKKGGVAVVGNDNTTLAINVAQPFFEKNGKNITLLVGETKDIKYDKLFNLNSPVSVSEDKYPITWEAVNPKVAIVNDGKVTALAKGSTGIRAYVGGKTYTATVKVLDQYKAPAKLNSDASFTMNPLQTFKLKYDATNTFKVNGASWSGNGIEPTLFTSGKNKGKPDGGYKNGIVSITKNGKIKAIGEGETKITGKDTLNREVTLTVTVAPVSSKADTFITKGKSETIRFPFVTNAKAAWTSSDTGVIPSSGTAALEKNFKKGVVKGEKVGSSLITCSYNGFGFSTLVYVEDPSFVTEGEGNKLTKNGKKYELKLKVGEIYNRVKMKDLYQTCVLKSSKPAVAFVDENGVIYARSAGKAYISTKINGKTYKIAVTVQ